MTIFSLKGRTAVVTGGSRGIGGAIVELFAAHGAKVIFCHYRDEVNAAALLDRLKSSNLDAFSIECDVSDEVSVSNMAARVHEIFSHVDILVNCAGIGGEKAFTELNVSDWDRMIAVHLRGTFLVTHEFFPAMVRCNYGRVINISSQLAYKGAPGSVHYCAAKAGIVGFTRALSYEGAPHGITVNTIAPGPVETDLLAGFSQEWRDMKQAQLPIARFGNVDEIAPTALLLASDAGSFYIGQTLSPNGGDVML